MTPQSTFMVLAPIVREREAELRELLTLMNREPGCVDASNPAIPFERFETLHFARLVILDDRTTGDIGVYGLPTPVFPLYLAFLGDVDGETPAAFLAELAQTAADGLRAIFAYCEGFGPQTDLIAWMTAHNVTPIASYVNWRGRTVRRIREEAAIASAIDRFLEQNAQRLEACDPQQLHAEVSCFVFDEKVAGRLQISPDEPTPSSWQTANLIHAIGIPLLAVLLAPLLIVVAAVFAICIRQLEQTDPEVCMRVDDAHERALAELEDHGVSNQFTAMGSLKPGPIRRWTAFAALGLIDYGARHLYARGRLARVRTIHFARWVTLDDARRVVFFSNYDGSLESYMDDFINKVGFGLNLAFSNGVGYPRTSWLVRGGAKHEQKFKAFLRRHQLPTQVWYDAYPGLRAADLERNTLLREGIEQTSLTDAQARAWAALL